MTLYLKLSDLLHHRFSPVVVAWCLVQPRSKFSSLHYC